MVHKRGGAGLAAPPADLVLSTRQIACPIGLRRWVAPIAGWISVTSGSSVPLGYAVEWHR